MFLRGADRLRVYGAWQGFRRAVGASQELAGWLWDGVRSIAPATGAAFKEFAWAWTHEMRIERVRRQHRRNPPPGPHIVKGVIVNTQAGPDCSELRK